MEKCGAPCIINTGIGHHLIFCTLIPSHTGAHAHLTEDRPTGKPVRVVWTYTGLSERSDNDSFSIPSIAERCKEWAHVTPLIELKRGKEDYGHPPSLVDIKQPEFSSTGYLCQKEPGHSNAHERSGNFGPLGIKWAVRWE